MAAMSAEERGLKIKLLQFLICEKFSQQKNDGYLAELVRSNLTLPQFPAFLNDLYVVTCWRKDERFHKEVIEYATDYGTSVRSPHMDIEPVRDSVLYRWHTHHFPVDFSIEKPTLLKIRVILDGEAQFESHLLIEGRT
jgi:hypothetical protein